MADSRNQNGARTFQSAAILERSAAQKTLQRPFLTPCCGLESPRSVLESALTVDSFCCRNPVFGGDILAGMNANDRELLREFARDQSQDAFTALVERHLDLVYCAALRQVRSPQLAEEVAQSVFADLARDAARLKPDTILTGWLYAVTRRTAVNVVRGEARRQRREQIACEMNTLIAPPTDWNQIEPLLDEAMHALDETDRTAVLLRYFENKSLREVGQAIGTSDDAAQKRVSRAIERLREFFIKQGPIVGASGLVVVLSANAVQAAPAALARSVVAAVAVNTGAGASALSAWKGLFEIMANTKVVGTIVIAALVVPLAFHRQTIAAMRAQDAALQRQADQLIALQTENERLSKLAANGGLAKKQADELRRLSEEAVTLRPTTNEIANLRKENRRLQASLEKPKTPLQIKEEIIATETHIKDWLIAFYKFAESNRGEFPTSFEGAESFLASEIKTNTSVTSDEFEIVYRGSLKALEKPEEIIVIRQKQPREPNPSGGRKGTWARIYGFADGSVRLRQEAANNFDDYERQHMVFAPANNP